MKTKPAPRANDVKLAYIYFKIIFFNKCKMSEVGDERMKEYNDVVDDDDNVGYFKTINSDLEGYDLWLQKGSNHFYVRSKTSIPKPEDCDEEQRKVRNSKDCLEEPNLKMHFFESTYFSLIIDNGRLKLY